MKITPELLQKLEEAIHFSKFRAFARHCAWDEADVLEAIIPILIDHDPALPAGERVQVVCLVQHDPLSRP